MAASQGKHLEGESSGRRNAVGGAESTAASRRTHAIAHDDAELNRRRGNIQGSSFCLCPVLVTGGLKA
jgi:hypothetical protein